MALAVKFAGVVDDRSLSEALDLALQSGTPALDEVAPQACAAVKRAQAPLRLERYYVTQHLLGRGSFGRVFLGLDVVEERLVAVKHVGAENLARLREMGHEEKLRKEMEFLERADHPSVVTLYHSEWTQDSGVWMYMELLDGGDLNTLLEARQRLSEASSLELMQKLVLPVSYIHEVLETAHRDIKPQNFVLTRAGGVKLIDFGSLSGAAAGDLAATVIGSPLYMAPEIWSNQEYNPEKVDVYSMGVLLYRMVTGSVPWTGRSQDELRRNLASQPLRIPPEFGLSESLCHLLKHSLNTPASLRLSWAEFKEHEWLALPEVALELTSPAENEMFELRAQVSRLNQQLESATRARDQAMQAATAYSARLQAKMDEAEVLRGEKAQSEEALAKANARADRISASFDELLAGQQDVTALREQLAANEAALQDKEGLISDAEARMEQLESEGRLTEERAQGLRSQVEELQVRLSQAEVSLQQLPVVQAALEAEQAARQELQQETTAVRAALEEAKAAADESASTLQQVLQSQEDVQAMRAKLAEQETSLRSIPELKAALEAEKRARLDEAARADRMERESQQAAATLNELLQRGEGIHPGSRAELEAAWRLRLDDCNRQLRELTEALQVSRDERVELERQLNAEAVHAIEARDELLEQLRRKEEENLSLSALLSEMSGNKPQAHANNRRRQGSNSPQPSAPVILPHSNN